MHRSAHVAHCRIMARPKIEHSMIVHKKQSITLEQEIAFKVLDMIIRRIFDSLKNDIDNEHCSHAVDILQHVMQIKHLIREGMIVL